MCRLLYILIVLPLAISWQLNQHTQFSLNSFWTGNMTSNWPLFTPSRSFFRNTFMFRPHWTVPCSSMFVGSFSCCSLWNSWWILILSIQDPSQISLIFPILDWVSCCFLLPSTALSIYLYYIYLQLFMFVFCTRLQALKGIGLFYYLYRNIVGVMCAKMAVTHIHTHSHTHTVFSHTYKTYIIGKDLYGAFVWKIMHKKFSRAGNSPPFIDNFSLALLKMTENLYTSFTNIY